MNPESTGSPSASTLLPREVPAYASTRLIAYIGNKRALLPFLLPVFLELDALIPVGVNYWVKLAQRYLEKN